MNDSADGHGLSTSGGEGGIRTHGGLAPTAVFQTAALNHSATSPIGPSISPPGPSCERRAVNQAGRMRDFTSSLGLRKEELLGMGGWMLVGLSAATFSSAAVPVAVHRNAGPPATQVASSGAQPLYSHPAYAVPQRSAWETYKVRLAALAAQQGVRQSTILANVPGLSII